MSDNHPLSSSDKLMHAAIELIAERGYNGVSTKEIAEAAGFSEKTLFRQFGSKQNLLESAFDRFHYAEEMKKLFGEKLVWDLYKDLIQISRKYHEVMSRNRKLFQILTKDSHVFSDFHEQTQRHPRQLKEILAGYFAAMAEKGKLTPGDHELRALSFMWMNLGAFTNSLGGEHVTFPNVSMEQFIEESVRLFTRALTP